MAVSLYSSAQAVTATAASQARRSGGSARNQARARVMRAAMARGIIGRGSSARHASLAGQEKRGPHARRERNAPPRRGARQESDGSAGQRRMSGGGGAASMASRG